MSKKDIWKNLEFQKSDTVFTDGRKRIDGYIEGSFTRSEITTKLQELSDELDKKENMVILAFQCIMMIQTLGYLLYLLNMVMMLNYLILQIPQQHKNTIESMVYVL